MPAAVNAAQLENGIKTQSAESDQTAGSLKKLHSRPEAQDDKKNELIGFVCQHFVHRIDIAVKNPPL